MGLKSLKEIRPSHSRICGKIRGVAYFLKNFWEVNISLPVEGSSMSSMTSIMIYGN